MKKVFGLLTSILAAYSITAESNLLNYQFDQDFLKPIDISQEVRDKNIFSLDSGSLTIRVRAVESTNISPFIALSDPTDKKNYVMFYLNRHAKDKTDTFGVVLSGEENANVVKTELTKTFPLKKGFRTITYTFDKAQDQMKIYIDGQLELTSKGAIFFNEIKKLSSAYIGALKKEDKFEATFVGNISDIDLDENVLNDAQVKALHQNLEMQFVQKQQKEAERKAQLGAYRSDKYPIFVAGQGGAAHYRIPALLTTKNNVVIAAIDKRNQHISDWGNIDTVIRRSFDGGKTWQSDQVIIDLVEQSYGKENAAFLIDPVLVQDKNSGRIFMLIDMFPETKGFFGINNPDADGSGYQMIEGKAYRILTDNTGKKYTVREQGVVYDQQGSKTDYQVVVTGSREKSFKDLGDLYKNGKRLGNIFLQTTEDNSDAAPLKTVITSYLWLTYSDDDGATWSSPQDITAQIKADWMRFLGTGPGNGIQLNDGSLVVPIYYTNSNGKQSAAVIISKDGGVTWTRGESPLDVKFADKGGSKELDDMWEELTESQLVQLNNGDIKLFSRNRSGRVHISTSKDGGYTWQNDFVKEDLLLDTYSQLSVIKYSKPINGKEILIFANSHSPYRSGRVNGRVWLGEVQDDGRIDWKYSTTITEGTFAYSSLTELPNGDIGLMYEQDNDTIQYLSFNLQELLWRDNILYRDSRNQPFKYEYNSAVQDTLYKIGDGEVIKVGKGNNQSKIVVNEGMLSLEQSANNKGEKQAFSHIIINKQGAVRFNAPQQINLDNIEINGGMLILPPEQNKKKVN